ncbi:MAG: 4-hydroxythreonine-4-phosphate dehydrogenase PdxA [Gammaproteobacteria bacterium]|nr:4-hydroxythreonine-4-phosphate dehydrogenase PdxA [Gammaproteobacteria bacterium]
MTDRPVLAITMGDPAGVGPEILVKALSEEKMLQHCRPVVIGSVRCLSQVVDQLGVNIKFNVLREVEECQGRSGQIEVLDSVIFDHQQIHIGQISAESGRAAVEFFETAIGLALQEKIAGIVTCPINKEAVQLAGYREDIGHQEILARMTHAKLTATMLMTENLRVAHLSTHKSLADAVKYVRKPIIVKILCLTVTSLQNWGISEPRIAVAALNPHGGEGGMLGREEIDEIMPAVAEVQRMGLHVKGPIPADSVFYRAINGEFEAVLALYHDQGHIAIKVHNFADSITATMGVPFVRTSVDHGTAFDIAGKNLANHRSLQCAMDAAIAMIHGTLD